MASLLGVASLAVCARSLPAAEFGTLAWIAAYVTLVDKFFNFQPWQAIVSFGARALRAGDKAGLHAVVRFGVNLDVAGATLGVFMGVVLAPVVKNVIGWSDDIVAPAQIYSLVTFASVTGTAVGLLRLFDRFGALAKARVFGAAVKLVGVACCSLMELSWAGYAVAWCLAAMAETVFLLVAAAPYMLPSFAATAREPSALPIGRRYPGILRFALSVNVSTALRMISKEADILVVGALLGPSEVGAFKVVKQVSSIPLRLTYALEQSVYPELSRRAADGAWSELRRIASRVFIWVGLSSLAIWALVLPFMGPLLDIIAGAGYTAGHGMLGWYSLAIVVAMATCVFSPAMLAMGRASTMLMIQTVSAAAYFCVMPNLVSWLSLTGAGVAYLVYYAVWAVGSYSALTCCARR